MRMFFKTLLLAMLMSNMAYGQTLIQTGQDMRRYFADNISILDPIVGEYDVELYADYITPYVHQKISKCNEKIFIFQDRNGFRILSEDLQGTIFRLEKIGETNAYRMYSLTTPSRIYLQENQSFKTIFELNHEDAKDFIENDRLSPRVKIYIHMDAIKIYPTPSMYLK